MEQRNGHAPTNGGPMIISTSQGTSLDADSDDGGPDRVVWGLPPPTPLLLDLRNKLEIERAVVEGAEALLAALAEDPTGKEEAKAQVEIELEGARIKVSTLLAQIAKLEAAALAPLPVSPPPMNGMNGFPSSPGSPYASDHFSFAAHEPQTASTTDAEAFGPTFELVLDLLQRLDEMEEAIEKLKAMDSIVAAVNRQVRVKFELKLEDVLPGIMSCLSEEAGKDVRAGAYRLLRHLIVDQHDVNQLQTRYFDLYLVRSLSRDHKFEVEKEQALRLVRLLLSLPDTDQPVPSSVIRAITAIAEQTEEKLRLAALQTLGELLIRDIALLVSAEGLRVVLQALTDGPHDISPLLAMGFLWVMDRPGTRQFLRPGVDVEIVLAGFTEVQAKGASQEERVKASAKIVASFLRSWSGIMYLNLSGRQALISIIDSLTNPAPAIRDTLLDMFYDILNVRCSQTANKGHNRTASTTNGTGCDSLANAPPPRDKTNLIDQYLSMLLLILIDAGLLEALVSVASDPKDAATARKVSLLIGEILQLSNRVLPLSYATRVQALPRLFSLASSFDTSTGRLAASSTLIAVDTFNRNRSRFDNEAAEHRPRSNSLEDPLKRGQRQVETTKMRQGMLIDDAQFRNLLLNTQVLASKDHARWSLDILMELLEGPLMNPKRLDEAMRASKFMRRLLSFFHPFNYRYSEIRKTKQSVKYTQLGCTLLTTLLASPDGVRYLGEDKLLRQIADCLLQLDPHAALANDVLLSKQRMENTLASGYFEMLGTLTRSTEGLKLLEQLKVFSSFYRISDLRSREDLMKAIIEHVDYSRDGHPRVLLSKALTSSYKSVRIFATQRLSQLITDSSDPAAPEWQIRLLLTQIYDIAPEVCELAVKVLEVACQSLETLEIVVQMRPSLDHLSDVGAVLLTKFLSTSIGVGYLHEIEFIDRELEHWFTERNAAYVVQVELLLASALRTDPHAPNPPPATFDGTPPPHFYGELVKTDEGCEILEESGHFPQFADFIRQHGLEDFDSDVIAQLKSVLWAVGQIGASVGGLDFLEQEFIVPSIVEIAEDSPVYSLRGTAYFVLGLISSTIEGVEMLDEFQWESVCTPLGGATGLCIPRDLANFVHTPLWTPPPPTLPESLLLAPPASHLERELLISLANLSNHILATKASKSLARLKHRHRELFSNPSLYYRALEMLANHHYRLSVRRYILELFDFELDERVVGEVMRAGEELREGGGREEGDGWRPGGGGGGMGKKGGLDGGFSDDEDDEEDGESESSVEEGTATIPLATREAQLTIRGFLITA